MGYLTGKRMTADQWTVHEACRWDMQKKLSAYNDAREGSGNELGFKKEYESYLWALSNFDNMWRGACNGNCLADSVLETTGKAFVSTFVLVASVLTVLLYVPALFPAVSTFLLSLGISNIAMILAFPAAVAVVVGIATLIIKIIFTHPFYLGCADEHKQQDSDGFEFNLHEMWFTVEFIHNLGYYINVRKSQTLQTDED
ncbi:MAG: hypothetical protein LBG86_02120 [Puniceicoccales bacterium]|jgi:hypothetical protein|nr:hypothetical protein [Puniceicoccales bacterium]